MAQAPKMSASLLSRFKRKFELVVLRKILTRAIPRSTKRLIVFLSPGHEFRAGGVMAIALMYDESKALHHLHQAEVAICTLPGDPPLARYSWFENSRYMLDLESLLKRCNKLDYLLLHIPDYAVNQVLRWLAAASSTVMQNIRAVHLNVMVFNIEMMKGQDVAGLASFGKVTCTTAHKAYSNPVTRGALGVPLHSLVICTGPEFYSRSSYYEKEDLLVISNDRHPIKEEVLSRILQALPKLRIQVIEDLSYDDYKKLIRRAKWSLTFGEGLDGYFAEPVFSGTISFAVYNDQFFTPDFTKLETVYPTWDVLADHIAGDIQRLDEPDAYNRCWQQEFDLLSDELNTDRFRKNLQLFYRGAYTYP